MEAVRSRAPKLSVASLAVASPRSEQETSETNPSVVSSSKDEGVRTVCPSTTTVGTEFVRLGIVWNEDRRLRDHFADDFGLGLLRGGRCPALVKASDVQTLAVRLASLVQRGEYVLRKLRSTLFGVLRFRVAVRQVASRVLSQGEPP